MSAQKKVLVTGASRGIGKAIIESFAKEGNYLIGTATSIEGAKTIDEIISSNDSSGAGLVLDLNDDNSIEEFFKILKGKDLYPDILVNNAGFTRDNIFLRMKDDEWSDVLNVHLNAQFKIIKNLVKPMLKKKYGRIINLSSAAAAIGNKGQANYVAAKSGIEAMSRTLAREFGLKNITINCVAPGFIETDMTDSLDEEYKKGIASQIPLQRFGKANEVAELIKFLTSSEADYITGQTIHINGGLFM